MSEFTNDELYEVFYYLDELRDSGETNMFGSSAYVQRDFGWDQTRSRNVTALWMETFDPDSSVSARVEKALNK